MISREKMIAQCATDETINTLNALAVGIVLGQQEPDPANVYDVVRTATGEAAERLGFEEYAGYGDDSTEGVIMRRRMRGRWEYVNLWLSFDGVGGKLTDEWPYVELAPVGFDNQVDDAYEQIMADREE